MRVKAEKELDMIHIASKMIRCITHFALAAAMLVPFASSATTVKALSFAVNDALAGRSQKAFIKEYIVTNGVDFGAFDFAKASNYFIDSDFSSALGVGKLITSVTMTVFYICLYYIYLRVYGVVEDKKMSACVRGLSVMRIVLCLMPQNRWLTNDGPLMWGIIRNIPFAVLGAVIVALYFGVRKEVRAFQNVWLYVTLSFLFYFPVVVGAGAVPILGMFMLPKTVCYMLILFAFKNKTKGEAEK